MKSKEKIIIEKLINLAEKQQKVLTKLAQAQIGQEDVEANKAWLAKAWQIACLNSSVVGRSPESIEFTPGGPTAKPGVTTEGVYTITGAIPEEGRMRFKETFERQVASQKPELDGRIGMIFRD